MILKDALRYYELTACDFQTDLEAFGKLQRDYMNGIVSNNFTDDYEGFIDKLLILWTDKQGGVKKVLEDELELPNDKELISMFCRVINQAEEKEVMNQPQVLDDDLLRKKVKKKKELKVLNLVSSMATADMNLSQFMDLELELVYQMLEIVADNKKKEQEKAKRRNRKV